MKVKYKNSEPKILLQPKVYAIFDYISKNVKTNLIWCGLVRKMGSQYIIEDVYFPPQNVNQYTTCAFDEGYLASITRSTFVTDYRPCKFSMIGKFVMGKATEIDDTALKYFDKLAHPSLDECIFMQLNEKAEMSFGINRKANFLSELSVKVNMEDMLDVGSLKAMLEKRVGKYTPTIGSSCGSGIASKAVDAEKPKTEPTSALIVNKLRWFDVL